MQAEGKTWKKVHGALGPDVFALDPGIQSVILTRTQTKDVISRGPFVGKLNETWTRSYGTQSPFTTLSNYQCDGALKLLFLSLIP